MYKKILSACIALLVTTAIYTILLYKAEKIDRTLIFERLIDIVESQFHWYGIAAYGIEAIFQFVNASKYLSFILIGITSSWLAVLKFFGQKTEFEELFVTFCGFILMLGTVVAIYMLLRNHSDIHVFFVDRYLFVFAGTVYFFLLWLIISSRRFLPRRQGNRQT
jgi:hypothetical protein